MQILGRKGRKGATFADLKEALEKYRRSTARKSTSGEYGLLGDAIPERSQLAWVSITADVSCSMAEYRHDSGISAYRYRNMSFRELSLRQSKYTPKGCDKPESQGSIVLLCMLPLEMRVTL